MAVCLSVACSIGCVGPFGWRSDPPWLTTWMEEGELAVALAKQIPLGASRETVLANLDKCGVKPFSAIEDDGEYRSERFTASVATDTPRFSVDVEYDIFPYLNHNYYIESDCCIGILVSGYRSKPPMNTFVTSARAVGGEVIVHFEEDKVQSVVMRPLDDEPSKERCPHIAIASRR